MQNGCRHPLCSPAGTEETLEAFDHILIVEDIVEWLRSGWGLCTGKVPKERYIADVLQTQFINMKRRQMLGLHSPVSAPVIPLPRNLASDPIQQTSASAPIGPAPHKRKRLVFDGVVLSRRKPRSVQKGKEGRQDKEEEPPRKKIKLEGKRVEHGNKGEGSSGGNKT